MNILAAALCRLFASNFIRSTYVRIVGKAVKLALLIGAAIRTVSPKPSIRGQTAFGVE